MSQLHQNLEPFHFSDLLQTRTNYVRLLILNVEQFLMYINFCFVLQTPRWKPSVLRMAVEEIHGESGVRTSNPSKLLDVAAAQQEGLGTGK